MKIRKSIFLVAYSSDYGDVWAFADDLAFGFKSRKEYNDKCKIIDDWCLQFKMKLNENKCEVMIRNSRTAVLDSKFRKVETIRYLGVHIAKNLSLKPHLESMKTKIDYISYKINMISIKLFNRHINHTIMPKYFLKKL